MLDSSRHGSVDSYFFFFFFIYALLMDLEQSSIPFFSLPSISADDSQRNDFFRRFFYRRWVSIAIFVNFQFYLKPIIETPFQLNIWLNYDEEEILIILGLFLGELLFFSSNFLKYPTMLILLLNWFFVKLFSIVIISIALVKESWENWEISFFFVFF